MCGLAEDCSNAMSMLPCLYTQESYPSGELWLYMYGQAV